MEEQIDTINIFRGRKAHFREQEFSGMKHWNVLKARHKSNTRTSVILHIINGNEQKRLSGGEWGGRGGNKFFRHYKSRKKISNFQFHFWGFS